MPKSLRVLMMVVAVLGGHLLAFGQENEAIEIKFRRAEAPGSRCVLETSFSSEISYQVDDLTAPDVIEDIKKYERNKGTYRFVSKRVGVSERKVVSVDKDELPTEVVLNLKSVSEKVGRQKEEKTVFDAGSPVTITGTIKTWGANTFVCSPAHGLGGNTDAGAMREVMAQLNMALDNYDFDSVYGVKEKKIPGESWPVNAPAMLAALEGSKWCPAGSTDISGEVKFLRYGAQNKKACAMIEAVTVIKNVPTGLMKGEKGTEADKMEVTMTVRVALPTDGRSQGMVLSRVVKGRLSLPAIPGRNAATVEVLETRGEDKIKPAVAERR